MQYKDELRKVIRKYKEYKSDENCSLNDMLKMYLSVKSITKNLDDYDHIKLITEQDPLQVKNLFFFSFLYFALFENFSLFINLAYVDSSSLIHFPPNFILNRFDSIKMNLPNVSMFCYDLTKKAKMRPENYLFYS
jgi:hypothetical protein